MASMSLSTRADIDTTGLAGDATIGDVKRSLKVSPARKPIRGNSSNSHFVFVSRSQKLSYLPVRGWILCQVRGITHSLKNTRDSHPSLGRRFATFKLFYNDSTPDDYEPPKFVPADAIKDRLVFSTHDVSEAPEKVMISLIFHSFPLLTSSL